MDELIHQMSCLERRSGYRRFKTRWGLSAARLLSRPTLSESHSKCPQTKHGPDVQQAKRRWTPSPKDL